jgi:hypothetical protein
MTPALTLACALACLAAAAGSHPFVGLPPLTDLDRAKLASLPRAFAGAHSSSSLPTSFDARTNWPGCIGPVVDQGTCGSCWAVSSASVISDRLCIGRRDVLGDKNATFVALSALQIVSCDMGHFSPGHNQNKGCKGGQPWAAFEYAEKSKEGGLVSDKCLPYLQSDGGPIGTCTTEPCLTFQATPKCPTKKTCKDGEGAWSKNAHALEKGEGSYVVSSLLIPRYYLACSVCCSGLMPPPMTTTHLLPHLPPSWYTNR